MNEQRLIDANALIKDMETLCSSTQFGRRTAKMCIKRAPTVPAEVAVHCEDCNIHNNCTFEDTFKLARIAEENRYCCAGKRRESEDK